MDNDAVSPLLLAAMWGRAGAVKALITGGCKADTTDKDGRSAVYWAAQEGHMDVLMVGYVCLGFDYSEQVSHFSFDLVGSCASI